MRLGSPDELMAQPEWPPEYHHRGPEKGLTGSTTA